jgi:iron complex transport system ATP-binding protein
MSQLFAEQLHIGYGDKVIIDQLNLSIPAGEITALVGANGSGKSTLLKTMARLMKPGTGGVFLDGKSIHKMPTKEVAKRLAILPQHPVSPEGLTVQELVSYGRFPHQSGLGSLTPEDKDMMSWAIGVTGMTEFADRPIEQMSGGQRQRAWIAMALAQGTEFLFLDEPTTYLDMAHQLEVLNLLDRLHRDEKRTIVMVVHDLNHASQFAHRIVAIRSGEVLYEGTPEEVITSRMLHEVFSIQADVIPNPRTGKPLCLPYGLATEQEFSLGKDKEMTVKNNQPLVEQHQEPLKVGAL